MTRKVDFDQICAETAPGQPIELTAGDKTFHVHPEVPWSFAVAWDEARVDDALAMLVPADELEDFKAAVFAGNASRDTALKRLIAIWNMEPGESLASSRSSGNGSKRSRPTSRRSTS